MSVHLVDESGANLCPEAELRDAMTDSEFWEHVFPQPDPDPEDFDIPPEVAAQWELDDRLATPCPECGQIGACAYDVDGRALIHVTETEG
jgi:hypothetical protein